ncbi:recombinase family protein [Enterococcus sp. 5H]|uniref:recombinase family protein n=1 Tax=Enterococcus sp. 5H TaxID=1229490 RepID=UPI002302CD8A|nr:recombinase family protein [Enterococcus sp. 5H]MDA9472436.1 DNA-invertase [Enterococcus sp. 5H]
MIFGYARVSINDQNLDMQIDALKNAQTDKIFKEKITGTKKERPELAELLKVIRPGDTIIIYKLDRISRSTKHLIELTELFEKKEVNFISIQDNIDTSTSVGKFFFRTMANLAELERDIIVERTQAGLAAARARGRHGGRPFKDPSKVETALKMYSSKEYTIKQITEATGLSKTTLYRYVDKGEQ